MATKRLTPYLIEALTSQSLERLREAPLRLRQRFSAEPVELIFFHQIDDPYSYLALETTVELVERYKLTLRVEIVQDTPLPVERQEKWERYRHHDAKRLAAAWRMSDFLVVDQPDPMDVEKSLRCCANVPHGKLADVLLRLSRALWNGKPEVMRKLWKHFGLANEQRVRQLINAGNRKRQEMGHYQAGTWNFAGKWYWGLDRLHFLEADLTRWGLSKGGASVHSQFFTPRFLDQLEGTRIDALFSFRSPYSYLALDRLMVLKNNKAVDLRLRPVMPMVLRGVPLSPEKRKYILMDSARIARRHQIPFGRISDPLGPGIKKCISLFYHAQEKNRELLLVQSLMRGIWSEGENVNSSRALARLCDRAGLKWDEARHHLDDEAASGQVEKNRQQLELMGLWGVPTFAVTDNDNRLLSVFWGQDRLPWLEYGLGG